MMEIINWNAINTFLKENLFLNDNNCYDKSIVDNEQVLLEIEKWIKNKEYKKLIILCVTQQSKNILLDYLKF